MNRVYGRACPITPDQRWVKRLMRDRVADSYGDVTGSSTAVITDVAPRRGNHDYPNTHVKREGLRQRGRAPDVLRSPGHRRRPRHAARRLCVSGIPRRGFTPTFADRYRVFGPERRGHGHIPDVEGPITYEIMADDTIAFIDALGIGPAHVVGWSDGANVGMIAAMQRPDLVHKLVLIGTAVNVSGGKPWAQALMEHFAVDHLPPMFDRGSTRHSHGRPRPLPGRLQEAGSGADRHAADAGGPRPRSLRRR